MGTLGAVTSKFEPGTAGNHTPTDMCTQDGAGASFTATLGGSKKASSSQLTRPHFLYVCLVPESSLLSAILTAHVPFCFYLLI